MGVGLFHEAVYKPQPDLELVVKNIVASSFSSVYLYSLSAMGVQRFGLFVRDLIKSRVKKGSSVVQTRRKGSLLSLPRRRA